MVSKMRLVDANVLLERVNIITADDTCPLHIAAEINQEIELAPTVDAVEVVHGQWIHHYYDSGKPIDDKWYCSECAMCNNYKRTWYCPHCGAKMDGDGNG